MRKHCYSLQPEHRDPTLRPVSISRSLCFAPNTVVVPVESVRVRVTHGEVAVGDITTVQIRGRRWDAHRRI